MALRVSRARAAAPRVRRVPGATPQCVPPTPLPSALRTRPAGASVSRFDQYIEATRNGITTLVAKRVSEPVELVVQNIYQWWAEGKIKTDRSPQKALLIEQVAEELTEEQIADILSDIEEKKRYRYSLLDQLVDVLEKFTNSINLHQDIGRYLGVDKFQMDRIYQTVSGEMVRSKSEVIITDLLAMYNIPFKYEERLEAGGYGFWPDFTIKTAKKVYYWEHLGRLDLEQYRQNWVIKKAWYEEYFPGQLITTEEGSTLSQTAENLIKTYLLSASDKKPGKGIPKEKLGPDKKFDPGSTNAIQNIVSVNLWTEGRTDWKHIKAAFTRLKAMGHFPGLAIEFSEDEDDMGDKELLNSCRTWSRRKNPMPIFLVFDRDVPSTLKNVVDENKDYKFWGNRVYSIALPIPPLRQATPEICIEFYYQDDEISQADEKGRRLFIGTEFKHRTGIHESGKLTCTDRNKVGKFSIIDDQVFRIGSSGEENIAMTKNQFANNVLNGHPGFEKFDITGFIPLFRLIQELADKETDT